MGRHPATDRVVLRYGLHLYHRNSTIWQVYIRLKKRDPIRKSLWTDDLAEAKELAWQEYTDAKERLVRNEPLRAVTFKKLTEDYLLTKAAKPSVQYHKDTIKRHFTPYFTANVADFSRLTDNDIVSYMQWRRQKSANEGKTLSNKTLNRENSVLSQIVKHALKRGYLTKESAPTVERETEDHFRRPNFTRDEYAKLRNEARSRIGEIKTRTRTQEEKDQGLLLPSNSELKETRRLLYDYIIFMANTGIRASEAKHLRWRHIDFKDELVKLDARITKNRKPREVVGRDPAMTRLKAIRTRQDYVAKVFGATVKQSDYVFSLPDVSGGNFQLEQVKSFRTAFNNLLKACGFEYDAQSQKHAITSLRHTYATIRLEEGTAIEALANNMGTSVRMIEQHYGHVRTRDQREELTKQRTRLR